MQFWQQPEDANRADAIWFRRPAIIFAAPARSPQVLTNDRPRLRRAKTALGFDKADNTLQAFAFPQIGHDKGPFAAHPPGVDIHFLQGRADMRREIDLVDDQEV